MDSGDVMLAGGTQTKLQLMLTYPKDTIEKIYMKIDSKCNMLFSTKMVVNVKISSSVKAV